MGVHAWVRAVHAGDLGSGVGGCCRARSRWSTGIHICSCTKERFQDRRVIAVDDSVVGTSVTIVGVGDAGVGTWGTGGVITGDFDGLEGRVVISVILDIGRVPVHETASPFDGSFTVGGESCGPEGELDTGGSLREFPLVGGGIPGIGPLQGTTKLTVNIPANGIWGPVDLIGVVVAEGV